MSLLLAILAVQGALQTAEAGPRRAQPVAPLATLFSNDDYPLDALRRNIEGVVGFVLTVDASGQPSKCDIAQSSGDEPLDRETCAILMARARFFPAQNARGEPVFDRVRARVRWQLAGVLPRGVIPFTALRVVSTYSIGSEEQASCTSEVNGIRELAPPCPQLPPDFTDFLRAQGRSARLVFVALIQPAADPTPLPAMSYGRLLGESEAEVAVSASGEVSACRLISRTVYEDAPIVPPDTCLRNRFPRFSIRSDGRERAARIRQMMYIGEERPG